MIRGGSVGARVAVVVKAMDVARRGDSAIEEKILATTIKAMDFEGCRLRLRDIEEPMILTAGVGC
jgi:hypothetical protein